MADLLQFAAQLARDYCKVHGIPHTEQVEVICHRRSRDDFWWDVFVDGELTHEHCDREDLERLNLDRYPVSQTYYHN